MGKRKRGGTRKDDNAQASEYEPKAHLKLNSYEDVADSEDEFHVNRDKILLDDGLGSKSKRLKQQEDDFLEPSDEEILGYENEEEDSDANNFDDEEEIAEADEASASASQDSRSASSDEDDTANWGPSKSTYYDADKLETEQDYLDEETEARRIQQKRLKALRDANLDFDEDAWRDDGKADEAATQGDGGVITEVLPQLQITLGMTEEEKEQLLYKRYPEFEYLADDFLDLKEVHEELTTEVQKRSGDGKEIPTVLRVKQQAATAYLGTLTLYFALLSSTASNDIDPADARPLPAHELRDHEIMETLVRTRELWGKVEGLVVPEAVPEIIAEESSTLNDVTDAATAAGLNGDSTKAPCQPAPTEKPTDPKILASRARRAARLKEAQLANAALDAKIAAIRKRASNPSTTSKPTKDTNADADSDSDASLGDEAPLNAEATAEKARQRKSLRFYTSQIAQKANRRERAGQGVVGGDEDLPYRERWRDKVERLNREAEKRGRRKAEEEEEVLGREDEGVTNLQRETRDGDVDGKEDELTAKMRAKKINKSARDAAHRAAQVENAQVVPYEKEEVGPDGRRQIGYTIQKNKGLTPKRKKEVKNPRVKKRMRYEDKSKKLRSMKPTYKGGEGKGGYGGELTGIKSGLVRSTKL